MIKKSWVADSLRDYSSSESPLCISTYKGRERQVKTVHIVTSAAVADLLLALTVTDNGFNGFFWCKDVTFWYDRSIF